MGKAIMRKFKLAWSAAVLAVVALCAGASITANAAITLAVGAGGTPGDHILGEVIPGLSSSGGDTGLAARDMAMINVLLGMGTGTRSVAAANPEYYRSTTTFGSLSAPTLAGMMFNGSVNNNLDSSRYLSITPSSAFQYLVATWDGQNSGTEVWYIGNIAAGTEILIPRYVHPEPSSGHPADPTGVYPQDLALNTTTTDFGLTTWTMFNPTVVPEPTTMIAGFGAFGLLLLGARVHAKRAVIKIGS